MSQATRRSFLALFLSLLGLLGVGVGGATAACTNAGAPGAGSLPDCRAYELVSAVDKNGGDVMPEPESTRIADDGTAVSYASLSSFGDTAGGGIATQYMSVRASAAASVAGQGWATHGIIPPQSALTFQAVIEAYEPRYQRELSPDLSTGVLFAWKPVTANPFVANVANLYLRDDLRTPGKGNYTLITACPACISPLGVDKLGAKPQFVGASAGFANVLFESKLNLVPGASGGGVKLYEWVRGTNTLRLVGVYPNGAPAADAAAGGGTLLYPRPPHLISDDGSKVFFTAEAPAGVTNVYMRLDGTTTVKLNQSEAASVSTPSDATYWGASVSGSRVFFTTDAQLTDDATGGTGLYMYDTTKPDTAPDNLTYLSADNEPTDPTSNIVNRVVGASADGRTVYFLDTSQLVAGAPPLETSSGMFVWHDGVIRYIASLAGQDQGGTMEVSAGGDLVFPSSRPVGPTGYDHGECPTVTGACRELYFYRVATDELLCASCDPSGQPGEGSAETDFVGSVGGSAVVGHRSRNITDDGRRVFFSTADSLLPEDTNGLMDAYVFDTMTETVSLLSSGHDDSDSGFLETTPSGDDALIITQEQLVGWDVDSNYDLYDVRVGGGFPEPVPTPAPCDSLACRGSLAGAPHVGAAASAAVNGRGNRLERRCRRNQRQVRRKGKVRCVKKPGRRRTTGGNRRAAR